MKKENKIWLYFEWLIGTILVVVLVYVFVVEPIQRKKRVSDTPEVQRVADFKKKIYPYGKPSVFEPHRIIQCPYCVGGKTHEWCGGTAKQRGNGCIACNNTGLCPICEGTGFIIHYE